MLIGILRASTISLRLQWIRSFCRRALGGRRRRRRRRTVLKNCYKCLSHGGHMNKNYNLQKLGNRHVGYIGLCEIKSIYI
jgi:hypothetical protein